jgi:hypothetical protein
MTNENPEIKKEADLKAEAKLRADKKKEEERKKSLLPKPKFYYDVKVECMLPATLTYRVLAEDPNQAAAMIKGRSPNSVHHKLIGRKEMVLRVYDASGSMMRLMKKLLGM